MQTSSCNGEFSPQKKNQTVDPMGVEIGLVVENKKTHPRLFSTKRGNQGGFLVHNGPQMSHTWGTQAVFR